MVMNYKRKAALCACSDFLDPERMADIERLRSILESEGVHVEVSPLLYGSGGHDMGQKKADIVNAYFCDPEMDYIFDVSGGDLANTVLPYLDYEAVRASRALFFGYSDLTTVLNAVISKTGRETVNWQVRNLLYDHAQEQLEFFREYVLKDDLRSYFPEMRFLRGEKMAGRILGGNTRCFLKLAGTPYWPDLSGAVLLLESYGGGPNQMATALQQYSQMGVLDQVDGVLLGTFTQMEDEKLKPSIGELVLEIVPDEVPVAKTVQVGHRTDARAVMLGRYYELSST